MRKSKCVYEHVYAPVCTNVYMHVYTHAYTHAYTHVYAQAHLWNSVEFMYSGTVEHEQGADAPRTPSSVQGPGDGCTSSLLVLLQRFVLATANGVQGCMQVIRAFHDQLIHGLWTADAYIACM